MPEIKLLSQETIDKIAAGEVVERPASVVKELVENAIDAHATAITVEIKEGGISLIRITDNGCGIEKNQVQTAFLRHSTSKIRSVEDLLCIHSLGFRGEALSSIAAVSRVELITKTANELSGTRYQIEGSKEIALEEIGAPEGTTFLIKDLFYNTPARKKFLKSAPTEAGYIGDIVEHLALCNPNVSFKFINNNQTKLHTSGNGNRKDLIYHIYGREIASAILEVEYSCEWFKLSGYLGKPSVYRGNRNFENFFINGRYIKSPLLSKATEDAYKKYLMQHQFPFASLYFELDAAALDVNVHPNKMELRFDHQREIYNELCKAIDDKLAHRNLIPEVPVGKEEKVVARTIQKQIPEPFETRRLNDIRQAVAKDSPYEIKYPNRAQKPQKCPIMPDVIHIDTQKHVVKEEVKYSASDKGIFNKDSLDKNDIDRKVFNKNAFDKKEVILETVKQTEMPKIKQESKQEPKQKPSTETYEEITLASISPEFMTKQAKEKYHIIGQLFKTYWLIEYEDKLFIVDQHAAHEKVLYERTMALISKKEYTSQVLNPPMILTLDAKEEHSLEKFREQIEAFGYVVEHFGGKEYKISGVPGNLYKLDLKDLFIEMLDDFCNLSGKETPELINEKVASMSCKAAVKGNNAMSLPEVNALIDELLSLENPYNCPHGRPTIISMSKFEIEKKFKRIV